MDSAALIGCITGCIGCLTGVVSLIISLKQNSFQRGKITIEQAPEAYSYYFDSKKCEKVYNWVNTKFPAVLSVQITNSTNYPVSITKAFLKQDTIEVFQGNGFHHDRIGVLPNSRETIPEGYKGDANYLEGYSFTDLPLTLNPFESVQVAFGFPFAEKLIPKYGETLSVELVLHTSQGKTISTPVNIVEYFAHFT